MCRSMMQGWVVSIFNHAVESRKAQRMNERAQEEFDNNTGDAAVKLAAKNAVLRNRWAHADNNQLCGVSLAQ